MSVLQGMEGVRRLSEKSSVVVGARLLLGDSLVSDLSNVDSLLVESSLDDETSFDESSLSGSCSGSYEDTCGFYGGSYSNQEESEKQNEIKSSNIFSSKKKYKTLKNKKDNNYLRILSWLSILTVCFNILALQSVSFLEFLKYGSGGSNSWSAYNWVTDPAAYIQPFFHHLTVEVREYYISGLGISLLAMLIFPTLYYISERNDKSKRVHFLLQILGVFCGISLFINITTYLYGGWNAKALWFPDVYMGHIFSPSISTSIFKASYQQITLFIFGTILDITGCYMKYRLARDYASRRILVFLLLSFALLLSIAKVFLSGTPSCNTSDRHWVNLASRVYTNSKNSLHITEYLPVHDIHLAVDIYLPSNYYTYLKNRDTLSKHNKIPTVLNITRYNRSTEIRWPFTLLSLWGQKRGSSANIWSHQMQQTFVANGYAVVHVDTRGTGATAGSRPLDLSAIEIGDFSAIVSWVKSQWWSNGKVAAGGVSYDGMTGMLTAANSEIDAVISLFSPMDVVGSLISPGGTLCSAFINDYTGLTKGFEKQGNPVSHILQNVIQYPIHVVLGFLYVFGGPVGVKGREMDKKNATAQHSENWEMGDMIEQVSFMDDSLSLKHADVPLQEVGIKSSVMTSMAAKKVDTFIVAGYCDSSSVQSAIELFNFMQTHNPNALTKMTLGSWTHGGKRSCSPVAGSWSCYEQDMYRDVVRFLDCSLKGDCWGNVLEEAPVHFWQVGREDWGAATTYPPPAADFGLHKKELQSLKFNLGADKLQSHHIFGNNTIPAAKLATKTHFTSSRAKMAQESWTHFFHDLLQIAYTSYYESAARKSVQHRIGHYNTSVLLLSNEHSYLLDSQNVLKNENVLDSQNVLKIETVLENENVLENVLESEFVYEKHNVLENNLLENENIIEKECIKETEKKEIKQLNTKINKYSNEIIKYEVDYAATSGKFSRWYIAQHPFGVPVHYGNRLLSHHVPATQNFNYRKDWNTLAKQTKHATNIYSYGKYTPKQLHTVKKTDEISWTSPALDTAIEVAGQPEVEVTVFVQGARDIFVFAYLEDVDLATGISHYVTEGNIMPTHRLQQGVPTYTREHYEPIHPDGEHIHVKIQLQPVSHTWRPGHALRLVLAGNDADNFDIPHNVPSWLPTHWHLLAAPKTKSTKFTHAHLQMPTLV